MNGKKTLVLLGAALLVGVPLFAGGEQEGATELEMPPQPRQYISPADGDGVNDELELPFSTIVVQSEDAVIVEYELAVFDADGNVVWRESQVEEDRVGFFGRLFGADKPRVEVPDTLTWDGTYKDSDLGEDGEAVEDGDYTYQLFVRDDQERISRTPPFNVTVDNEAPEITELGPPEYRVFAPTEDSDRQTVSFPQDGSREAEWVGTITDADGNTIWRRTWENPTPENRGRDVRPASTVTWDGTYRLEDDDRSGYRVPEGTYTYTLASTDRAGNSTEETADWDIAVSMQSGGVTLEVDAENAAFSPNDDGRRDELPFTISVREPDGAESWELEVRDPRLRNPVVRRVTGEAPVPRSGTFDGADEEGEPLRDGTYEARLYVRYENGIVVSSETREFVIDTEAPRGSLAVDTLPQSTQREELLAFGGTNKQELSLRAEIDPEADWTAIIGSPEGELEVDPAAEGFRGPEIETTWDGTDLEGNEVPDGEYSLQLRARDRAGNVGTTREISAIKDTRPRPIDLTIDGDVVFPTRDGEDAEVTIRPEYEVEEYIDEFHLEIRNADGELVRSVYRNEPFDEFTWNGRNNAGGTVAEGEYTVDFQIIYHNGDEPRITGVGPIYVEAPTGDLRDLEMSVEPLPFSPDDDGVNDTLRIELRVPDALSVERWSVDITDPMDNGFKSWSGDGNPPRTLTWNGLSDDGELVQSAVDYEATFRVIDSRGNEFEVERVIPTDILVMREGDRLRIRIPSIHFAAFTADLFDIEIERQDENFRILRRLYTVLDRYPDYEILIEGHANHILFEDEEQKRVEQEETLIPLSRDRAQEVKEGLIILGIERDRMDVEGVGGARPVVPFADKENVWKNRRVEFLLER
ncbi:MAG: FlgD immunoglobulin-like domain containing protein [Spirochaetaceae bacterium]